LFVLADNAAFITVPLSIHLMMRLAIILMLFILLPDLFISCSTQCACDKALISFNLVSFTDSEANTIILRRFNKDGQFSSPLDSAQIFDTFNRSGDSLIVTSSNGPAMTSSNDYELYFPTTNITVKISDIIEDAQEEKCGGLFGSSKAQCVNKILSYKQNGTLSQVYTNNFIYITK
jgi:hypothetical protein